MTVTIRHGDCREILRTLPDESVNCCVTSPPYFGLRDYGVDGQIGLESSPEEYISKLVWVFAETRRVLRNDGTLWLNLGDSYTTGKSTSARLSDPKATAAVSQGIRRIGTPEGLKPKDLLGIPWRVAFALQRAGWYLRQDIIWSKPNPMPESVTDRCTKAHEYLFLLSKSMRYYFDHDAIAQDVNNQRGSTRVPGKTNGAMKAVMRSKDSDGDSRNPGSRPHSLSQFEAKHGRIYPKRNKRSVWEVATQPFSEAHFATFPPELIEPCIRAGSPVGGMVLDPFGGAGTTGLVADRLERDAILIELNPEYAAMAERRIRGDAGMFADVSSLTS